MERRNLFAGCVVLVIGMLMVTGSAFARTIRHKAPTPSAANTEEPICVVHAAGHSKVLVEVECKAVYAEQFVQISAHELASRCPVTWLVGHSPIKFEKEVATVKKVQLDDAGNAEVALIAGSSCGAGDVLVSAQLEDAPYTTVTTSFTVTPPRPGSQGVSVVGAENKPHQVEDAFDSSLFEILKVQFPAVDAEQEVEVTAEQLFARCNVAPHLVFIKGSSPSLKAVTGETVKLKLNDDGSASAIIAAEESCASGASLIEASLVIAPYTTLMTEFTVESPHETI